MNKIAAAAALIISVLVIIACVFLSCRPGYTYTPSPPPGYEETKAQCFAYIRDNRELIEEIIASIDKYDCSISFRNTFDSQDRVTYWAEDEQVLTLLRQDEQLAENLERFFGYEHIFELTKVFDENNRCYRYIIELHGVYPGFFCCIETVTPQMLLDPVYRDCENVIGRWYYTMWQKE